MQSATTRQLHNYLQRWSRCTDCSTIFSASIAAVSATQNNFNHAPTLHITTLLEFRHSSSLSSSSPNLLNQFTQPFTSPPPRPIPPHSSIPQILHFPILRIPSYPIRYRSQFPTTPPLPGPSAPSSPPRPPQTTSFPALNLIKSTQKTPTFPRKIPSNQAEAERSKRRGDGDTRQGLQAVAD